MTGVADRPRTEPAGVVRNLLAELAPDVSAAELAAVPLAALWHRLPFPTAAAVTEHVTGVVPLLARFDADPTGTLARALAGRLPVALGLLTPNAAFAWAVPAVRGQRRGGEVVLDGRVRHGVPGRATLTVVGLADEQRLCLLPHDTPGVEILAGRGWLRLSHVTVPAESLSTPVDWHPTGALVPVLDGYAWTLVAGIAGFAAGTIADLRRALAGAGSGTGVLSTSQYLAHELTRLEIETNLLAAGSRLGPGFAAEAPGGQAALALVAAATDLGYRVARTTDDLVTELGLAAPERALVAAELQGLFGGRRMVEAELARRMGLVGSVPE